MGSYFKVLEGSQDQLLERGGGKGGRFELADIRLTGCTHWLTPDDTTRSMAIEARVHVKKRDGGGVGGVVESRRLEVLILAERHALLRKIVGGICISCG